MAEVSRTRQATLGRDDPPRLIAVVGEAALQRVIGSPRVMAQQSEHLHRLVDAGAVDLRVLPYSVGAHVALTGGAFTIMEFDDEADPDVVYLEAQTSAQYLEDQDQLATYREVWNALVTQSVPFPEFSP
jgi:hypothetical protein